ncbi:MAG TPA: lipopolysaccharide biosynthesis protein, partial [Gemmataceae bacterium]|nr:lipopolysaccharide biosynthesis protein [Gemmataceae bacterium]
MISSRSFVKHAAVYGLAGLLVQAGGFVLLPLYTHCLTPADYGVLEVLGRLADTVGTCLMFGGLRQALMAFYQQSRDETERRQVVATLLSLLGTTILLGGGLVLVLAGPLSGLLNRFLHTGDAPLSTGLVRLALLAILCEPFTQMPLTLLQARVESLRFMTITVGQFLLRIALCVLLVKYLHAGVAGALGSSVIIGLLFGLTLSTREWLRAPDRPNLQKLRSLVRFALPWVPGGLCALMLHHGDRLFLLHYRDMHDVGTYSLGYKLAQAVGMFALSPLNMVWSSQMYKVAEGEDAPIVFGTVLTRILAAYLLVALALALFQDEVVRMLSNAAYAQASAVVAPVLLAYFFQSAASLMDAGLYVRHRMGLKLGVTLATTTVMLLMYALLIPCYGSMGAAIGTLIGFGFLAVCTWAVSRRVFPVRYEWPRLAALLSLAIGLWLVSRLLPAVWWVWPVKMGLWLLGPVLVWYTGLMSQREKEHVRGITGAARKALDNLAWSRAMRSPKHQPAASGERGC